MYTVRIRKHIPTRQFRKLVEYAQEICKLYPDATIEKIYHFLDRWTANKNLPKKIHMLIFETRSKQKVITIQHGHSGGAHVTILKEEA